MTENSDLLSKNYDVTATETGDCLTILQSLTEKEAKSLPDEHVCLRHLRAEKGNVNMAIEKTKAALRWRKEFGVDDIVTAFHKSTDSEENEMSAIIREENSTSKVYVRGYDAEGRALLYMRPAKENTTDMVNQMRHLVWNLEKAIACSSKDGRSKVCIVIDYEGFSLTDAPPISTSRYTLDILQKHYPERMYRAYICNPPFIFRTFWALIRPFIDPVTKQKIVFCHGAKGLGQIADDVGPDNASKYLEACAGGETHGNLALVTSEAYLMLPWNSTFGETDPSAKSDS